MLLGPLSSVVSAQAAASMSTVNFIQTMGFDEDNKAIMVDYKMQTVNGTTGALETRKISIPMIAMLTVPLLEVGAKRLYTHVYVYIYFTFTFALLSRGTHLV